jgi:tetratricopeptide (TPR) repeat protein
MARAETGAIQAKPQVRSLELRSGQHTYRVTMEKALTLAHSLLKARQYRIAERICEKVASVDPHNAQGAILLACCEAGMNDYSACQRTLQAEFSGHNEALAEHLQASFVYHHLGMNRDAIQELITLTDKAPDLSMAWVLLGDFLNAVGSCDKASLCWRLAIDRDKLHGGAAMAAQLELAEAKRKHRPMLEASDRPFLTKPSQSPA